MKTELLKGLTPEQVEKARACKNQEELLKLAKSEGIELNEEQLAAVSGGACVGVPEPPRCCPNCGSTNITAIYVSNLGNSAGGYRCECHDCNDRWIQKD